MATFDAGAADPAAAIVAVDVVTHQLGQAATTIDEPADDGTSGVVPVLDHREDQAPGLTVRGAEAVGSLHDVPAEVESPAACVDYVDLLPAILAHVRDVEAAGGRIEAEPPRVAQAPGPDLPAHPRASHERVVGRDRVGVAMVHVDAQQIAEQGGAILSVPVRIAGAAAVSHDGVEHAVGPEEH